MTTSTLAVRGGAPEVTTERPHFRWPPLSTAAERHALAAQRDLDISIKGKAGPIRELEDAFLEFLEQKRTYAITFNSGTCALMAAYFGLGIGEGDEVIGPAITYHAAMSPLYFLHATPVLVDVDEKSWTIDPQKIETAITSKTKAITVVHQWGHPADMSAILAIAKKHHLAVIEDCSHAHGSRYKGQLVGTFGDIAVFSLQANKIVFAGEGGILVTNSQEVHDRVTLLGHYRDRARDEIKNPKYQQFWATGYGLKLRMSPYNAITALYALKSLNKNLKERTKCLQYFSEQLERFPEITPPIVHPDVEMGAWYGFKPRFRSNLFHGIQRDVYVAALKAEGVEVAEPGSPAFTGLPLFTLQEDFMFAHHIFPKRVYKPGDFPVAERLAAEGLSFPTFTNWKKDRSIIDQYIGAIQKLHDNWKELR